MHTEIYTLFTKATGVSTLLYSADSGWVRVQFQLETAGPVVVSTREDVAPVLSGKGILLDPSGGEPVGFVLPKGDRIFYVADTVNRVKFIVEPIPWLERISYQIGGVIEAIGRIRLPGRKPTPPKPSGPQEPPCPRL